MKETRFEMRLDKDFKKDMARYAKEQGLTVVAYLTGLAIKDMNWVPKPVKKEGKV